MSDNEIKVAEDIEKATLPEKREFVISRPGHINYAEARGNYIGCKMMTFTHTYANGAAGVTATENMNEFFRQHANLLVVGIWPFERHVDVLYTNTLEGEELEEFNEYSRSVALHMADWKRERAERRSKRDEATAAAESEVKRLVAKGKKCEVDHGGLNKKLKGKANAD